jgi:D-amino peptidase
MGRARDPGTLRQRVDAMPQPKNGKGNPRASRRLMTEEINAAVAGAIAAGATDLLVVDSLSGQDIDGELLDKRARLIRERP